MKLQNDSSIENKEKCIDWGLFIVLVTNCFFSAEITLITAVVLIAIDIINNRKIFLKINCNSWIFTIIWTLGILMSYYSGYEISTHIIIRYTYYVLAPIIYFYFGYTLIKRNSLKVIFKTIFFVGIINIIQVICEMFINFKEIGISYYSLRSAKAFVTMPLIYILFIILLKDKNSEPIVSKRVDKYVLIIDVIILLITFSRTFLLDILSGFIVYSLYSWNTQKYGKIIMKFLLIFLIAMFVAVNNSTICNLISEYIEKIETSFEEVSTDQKWDFQEINNSWRGYEVYLAKKQFNDADTVQKIFGTGAKGVFVGNNSKLVSKDKNTDGFIPVLHNGYFGMLTYAGIIGLSLYLWFYISNIMYSIKSYKGHKSNTAMLLNIIIVISMVSTYIVMGIVSSTNIVAPICIMISALKNYLKEDNREVDKWERMV